MINKNQKSKKSLSKNSNNKLRKNCSSLTKDQNSNTKNKLLFDLYENKYKKNSRIHGYYQLSPCAKKAQRNKSSFCFSLNCNRINSSSKQKNSSTLSEFYLKNTKYNKSNSKTGLSNNSPTNKELFHLADSKNISKIMSCIYKNQNANKLKDINNLLDILNKKTSFKTQKREKIEINKNNSRNKSGNKPVSNKESDIFEVIPITINENGKLVDDKIKVKLFHLSQTRIKYCYNIDSSKYNDKTNTKKVFDDNKNLNIDEYETPNFTINKNK